MLAHQIAKELLANKGLSDATYAAAEASFSTEELVALVARVGFVLDDLLHRQCV